MCNKILAFVLAVIATVFMSANLAQAQFVDSGLVSYWPLDRASIKGKTVEDVWGKNDGTIAGNPQIVAGKIHEAMKFDAKNNDYVDCGNDKSLDLAEEITIEVWTKPSTADGPGGKYNCIVMKEHNGPYQLYSWGGTWKFRLQTNAGQKDVALGERLTPAQWVHVAAVYDGKRLIIYTNAKEAVKKDIGKVTINPGSKVLIGAYRTFNQMLPFSGLIDNVRIYNRALGPKEITQNFTDEGLAAVNSALKLATTWGQIKGNFVP